MAVVNTYQQASEPTDLTPGTQWYRDDGKAYIRKLDLTWNYIGEWQRPNFNHLHVEGGTMLGPILGEHGLAPLNNPAFTGTATLNDVDLADKQWTSDQIEALQTSLENFITGTSNGTSGTLSIGNNLAIGYGQVKHGETIELPRYGGVAGQRAALSEVWAVLPSIHDLEGWNSKGNDYSFQSQVSVDANLKVTCSWLSTENSTVGYIEHYTGSINYIIICKR